MTEVRCPRCRHLFTVSLAELAWKAACHVAAACAFCVMLYTAGSLPVESGKTDSRAFDVTVEDPSRFAASVLAERMRRAGICIEGGVRKGKPVSPRPVRRGSDQTQPEAVCRQTDAPRACSR